MAQATILNGSARVQGSYCRLLTEQVASTLRQRNIKTFEVHLAECDLPVMSTEQRSNPINPNVQELVQSIEQADFVIFVTPTYHNSYSGCLKNALDFLGSSNTTGKVAGLVCHAGGIKATEPLAHLRGVTNSLRMHTIIKQVCTNADDFVSSVGEGTRPELNVEVKNRVNEFVDELILETALRVNSLALDKA
jgi:NAD(P)H-dependent FMN reductase